MKISAIFIALASVAVAAPLPINDEHALTARGFGTLVSGLNPVFGKNKAEHVDNLHGVASEQRVIANAENVAIQGTHALNFGGIFGDTKKTGHAAEKSAKETAHANSAHQKASDAKAKAEYALARQESARHACEEVLEPTGFRDALGKIGKAVGKTAKAAGANAKANAAAWKAESEYGKYRKARDETNATLNQ